ncbi:MAG: LytR family transcriptional regulator [Acidimicrobiaceae bacterium]|nr:LytR family transcriptional regulator [Acidimicrobiaceae bacterium]MYH87534.1 LytR family transcriptional regulator [Acidimicrobiaceae bacterium]
MVAAALSVIWPGLGHIGHHNVRAAKLVVTTLTAAVGLGWFVASRSTSTLVTWGVSRFWLWLAILFAGATLVFRIAVAVDAYMVAHGWPQPEDRRVRTRRRIRSAATLVLIAGTIALPHFFVVRYAVAQLELLYGVFGATNTETAVPTPIDSEFEDPEQDSADGIVSASTTLPLSESPTLQTWDGEQRLTIALLGGDSGYDRAGVRTDTIIVLSIDVATGDAAAFNVPRNWSDLTFPKGTPAAEQWPDGYPGIANEVYALGLRSPEHFPNVDHPAGHAIKSALAQLTGLPIQYYVLIDMVGLVEAIDLFGGIDLHVTESINDRLKPLVRGGQAIDIVVEPGDYRFDGLTALGYVRSRTRSTDYHRMSRQRCVVEALISQISISEVLGKFVSLTGIISSHVQTDVPLGRVDELVDVSHKLDTSKIVTVNFIPPEFPRGSVPTALVREAVTEALLGVADEANAALSESCQNPE